MKPFRKNILLISAGFMFVGLLQYLLSRLVSVLINSGPDALIVAAVMIGAVVIYFAASYGLTFLHEIFREKMLYSVRERYIFRAIDLTSGKSASEIIVTTNADADSLAQFASEVLPLFVSDIFVLFIVLITIAGHSPLLARICFVLAMFAAVPVITSSGSSARLFAKMRATEEEGADLVSELPATVVTMQTYDSSAFFVGRYYNQYKKYYKYGKKSELIFQVTEFASRFAELFLLIAACLITSAFVAGSKISIKTSIAVYPLLVLLFQRANTVFKFIPQYKKYRVSIQRLEGFSKIENPLDTAPDGFEITVENVKPLHLLDNPPACFEMKSGDKIHIVGKNGSGKSSLLRCILGIDGYNGSIRYGFVGGQCDNLGDEIVENFAFLPQNLPNIDERVGRIVQHACEIHGIEIKDFKARLKRYGLDYEGFEGRLISSLSGGERKKIYLAYALLLGRRITVLDEPFNELDKHTQANLAEDINAFAGSMILVSHTGYFPNFRKIVLEGGGSGYE